MLLNLLTNAVKFQDSGRISVYSTIIADEKGTIIEVEVKDRGQGIDMDEGDDIFEPFSSTKKLKNSSGSDKLTNGVGLFICKKICEQLGGTITVNSILGVGSMFKFTMLGKDFEKEKEEGSEKIASNLTNLPIIDEDNESDEVEEINKPIEQVDQSLNSSVSDSEERGQ